MKTYITAALLYVVLVGCQHCDHQKPPPDLQIYVMVGDSQIVGQGMAELDVPDSRIKLFGFDNTWKVAQEPTHHSFDSIYSIYFGQYAGSSSGIPFAKQLLSVNPSTPIGLVPCGRSGTVIEEWLPSEPTFRDLGGSLFGTCTERLELAKEMSHGHLAGVIIHLGTNDAYSYIARNNPGQWPYLFSILASGIRTRWGNVPIVLAQLGTNPAPPPNWSIMQTQQSSVATSGITVVLTNDLPILPDGLHLTAQGERTLGNRFANVFAVPENKPCSESFLPFIRL